MIRFKRLTFFQKSVYDTLISCPHFVEEKPPVSDTVLDATIPLSTWKYVKPPPSEPSPIVKSLGQLSSAMPAKTSEIRTSPFSHVIETLSEFTGYISSQVYVPYQAPSNGFGVSSGLSPAEEQLKREIRALKGLVLNR